MDSQLRKQTDGFGYYSIVNYQKHVDRGSDKYPWSFSRAVSEAEQAKYNGENVLGVFRIIRLKGIACIDIDENVQYDDIIHQYPFLKGHHYVKGNTKGFHFYVNVDTTMKKAIDCFENIKGDFIPDVMFELEEKIWYNEIKSLNIEHIQGMMKTETDTESVDSKVITSTGNFLEDLIPLIEHKADNYADWVKAGLAFKSIDAYDLFLKFSQQSPKYDEQACLTFWKSANPKNITIGTLKYWAKEAHPKEYYALLDKEIKYDKTLWLESIVAENFYNDHAEDFLYCDKTIHVYFAGKWRTDEKSITQTMIQKYLLNYYTNLREHLLQHKDARSTDENVMKVWSRKLGVINSAITACQCNKMIHDVFEAFLRLLIVKSCDTENPFDKNPYLFCFKNKSFDLQTGNEIEVKREDYVLQNTGTEYIQPTTEQIELIRKLISQIFPNEEIKKTYLSILFMGMTAIRIEKFFLANGCGRNGKGLLNELFMELIGNYGYILPVDILTSKKDIASGANPQIANCHKKRFILSREPEEGAKLKTSIIKEMTGGCEINARQLYSGDCKVSMNQVQMLECNAKPALSGTMNEAILERIVDIPFESYFTSNSTLINESNNIYAVNTDYKLPTFRKEHTSALFHVLMEYNELYISPCIKKRSTEYVMSSDDIYTWVKENYDEGTQDDIVKAIDLYQAYTESESFLLMTKEERRTMTKKKFIELLKSSIAFKGKFFDTAKMINGVRYNDRIHCWKIKVFDKEPEPDNI